MSRPLWLCPACGRESLVDTETGESIYKDNSDAFIGRNVFCDWDCGTWLVPGDPKQFALDYE